MASPSKLHRLHRFFRHESYGSVHTCYWNIAAGALEKRQRLYRILYKGPTATIDDEITIDVHSPAALKEFFLLLTGICNRMDLDPSFKQACSDLLIEDPWLSMFVFSSSTNSRLQHDTLIADDV